MLIAQLPLYYFQYARMSQTSFLLLFSTNLMSLFIVVIHTFKMNTYEINRLTALWNCVDYKMRHRFQCSIEMFTLSIFAILRFLLANLDELTAKHTYNNFETMIQV